MYLRFFAFFQSSTVDPPTDIWYLLLRCVLYCGELVGMKGPYRYCAQGYFGHKPWRLNGVLVAWSADQKGLQMSCLVGFVDGPPGEVWELFTKFTVSYRPASIDCYELLALLPATLYLGMTQWSLSPQCSGWVEINVGFQGSVQQGE